ncbi:MAG: hypothetical protein JO191_11605 [Mycobacteriaceae bacterium]|nr:hypothetical protein [Mycobacteriaceae bacterium]
MARTPHTRTWQDKFLADLAEHGNISRACRKAGIGRSTAYDERARSEEFERLWEEAEEAGTDAIEQRVRDEAARPDGDPRLAIFWLKSRRRTKFGERFAEEEIQRIRRDIEQATVTRLRAEIETLPPEAQRILADSVRSVARRKELNEAAQPSG